MSGPDHDGLHDECVAVGPPRDLPAVYLAVGGEHAHGRRATAFRDPGCRRPRGRDGDVSRDLLDIGKRLWQGLRSYAIPPDDIDMSLVELGSAGLLVGQTEVMDYNLRSLGPAEFEALCKTIVMNVLGSDIKNLDPNRPRPWEAEFEGSFAFPGLSTETGWNGFGVLVVKFTSRDLRSSQAISWYR